MPQPALASAVGRITPPSPGSVKSLTPLPVNLTFFGSRVFADVPELRGGRPGTGRARAHGWGPGRKRKQRLRHRPAGRRRVTVRTDGVRRLQGTQRAAGGAWDRASPSGC